MKSTWLFATLLLLQLFSSINCYILEIQPNQEKCIKEEFKGNTLVRGTIEVEPYYTDMQLTLRVTDQNKGSIYENRDIRQNTFTFTSHGDDEYSLFCFTDAYKEGANTRVEKRFVKVELVTGETPRDYSDLAKKEHLKPVEVELKKIEDLTGTLKSDFTYLRAREARHRDTNESTNSRLTYLSFLSIAILLGLGVAQVYYLKTYFKSKKLI